MRPVDLQPAVVQAPSAERAQQLQQSQPQVSQQAFASQMERLAEDRAHQVRESGEGHEARPPEDLTEEKRGKPRQRNRRRPAVSAPETAPRAEKTGDVPPPPPGPHVDVRV